MNLKAAFGFILIVMLANTGCGGGSSSSDSPTEDASVSPLVINADNAINVSEQVVGASLSVDEFTSGGASLVVGVVSSADDQPFVLSDFIISLLQNQLNAFSEIVTGVSVSEAQGCTVSGQLSLSGDFTSGETTTEGDNFTFTFDDCDNGEGNVIDGTIGITFTTVEGELFVAPYTYSISMELSNLSVTVNGEVATTNGDFQLTLASQETNVETGIISGTSLAVTTSGEITTLIDFENTTTVNTNTGEYGIDASGSIESTELGGSLDFITIVTFAGTNPNNPDTGELLITGKDNSSLRLIVVDAVNVTLEVDTDGDDIIDETIATTWDELGR